MNMKAKIPLFATVAFCCWLTTSTSAFAQGTAFTYQGQLTVSNSPTHGTWNMTFKLWNAASGGAQVGSTITSNGVVIVTNGLFTVYLDFGNEYSTGTPYWLELGVETNGGGSFSTLAPRQQLTPTPYSIFAEGANATGLTGTIPAGNLSGTYSNPLNLNNPGNIFDGAGTGLTGVNAAQLNGLTAANFWQLTGNAGTTAGLNFVGTKDKTALFLDVNGSPVLELATNNSITMGNGTLGNSLGYNYEVALGNIPKATANGSVAIGWNPTSSGPGSVAIGESVISSADDSFASGGYSQATAQDATAMGYSTVASGTYSMALGYLAQALNAGSFVWADDSGGVFTDHAPNQFMIRAAGGVGIGTLNGPQQFLSVHGGLNIDQANDNAGFINNGSTNGYSLTFGSNSGEGIASQRQAAPGVNQYGLDFYTDFTQRLSIQQNGNILIADPSQTIVFPTTSGANNPMMVMFSANTVNADRMVIAHSLAYPTWGLQYQDVPDRFNFLSAGTAVMSINLGYPNGVGIGVTNPASALEVASGDVRVDGNRYLLESAPTAYYNNDGLIFGSFGLPGINYGEGPCLFGYDGGALGAYSPNTVCLSWDYSGDVWVSNNLSTATLTIRGGADLAEPFNINSANGEVPQGAVVVIDDQNPGHLRLSDQPYDTRVAGVVSGANGVNPGIQMHQQGLIEGGKNVALTGRVYVQADASTASISPGDMLTTSSTPGYAMKVSDHARAAGAILGKAMTGLSEGKGMVLVLVTLQ